MPDRRRIGPMAQSAVALTVALLAVRAVWPAPANAVDLFPVDDWLGSGIKKAGDVVLGPLKLGVREIAQLLASIVGALADLLVPKSLVKAGLGGIRWLVQLPPVGVDSSPQPGVPAVRMPHLQELRDTMTWIGVTLLPLGIVLKGGRAFLAPTADGESPAEVFGRALTAGLALLLYDWAWGIVTELSRLLTGGLLGLPWVADGVERMLETLVIGGATGSAVAAEFVVPLMIMIAGTVLLGLLLVRVGLEVATALLYVLGGLVFGLSVTNFGRRLLTAWLVAAAAIVALPLLWSTVFAVGAALMLDAGDMEGKGGFAAFVAQLYNVAAALAVFWIAIKLALGVFRHASAAITGITATPASSGGSAAPRGAGRAAGLAKNATPAGLARFSQGVRGAAVGASAFPIRHPIRTAHAGAAALRHPVQSTRDVATRLSGAIDGAASDARPRTGSSDRVPRGARTPGQSAEGNRRPERADSSRSAPRTGSDSDRAASRKRRTAPRQPRPSGGKPRASAPIPPRPKPPTTPPIRPADSARVTRPVWLRRPPKRDDSDRKDGR